MCIVHVNPCPCACESIARTVLVQERSWSPCRRRAHACGGAQHAPCLDLRPCTYSDGRLSSLLPNLKWPLARRHRCPSSAGCCPLPSSSLARRRAAGFVPNRPPSAAMPARYFRQGAVASRSAVDGSVLITKEMQKAQCDAPTHPHAACSWNVLWSCPTCRRCRLVHSGRPLSAGTRGCCTSTAPTHPPPTAGTRRYLHHQAYAVRRCPGTQALQPGTAA